MKDYGYYIGIDTTGRPYISHAYAKPTYSTGTSLVAPRENREARQNHKYYTKLENNLKTRYFYSKQEWDAYQRNRGSGSETRSAGSGGSTRSTASTFNRPTSHQRNITGEAKPGSVYRRGEGLGQNTPATGGTGYVPKTKKEKEYAEAIDSLSDYKKKQAESKVARQRLKENLSETAAISLLKLNPSYRGARREIAYASKNSARDTKASLNESVKVTGEQMKAAGKFLKEFGDYTLEAVKDSGKDKLKSVADKISTRK